VTGGKLSLLSARPAVTSSAAKHHPLDGTVILLDDAIARYLTVYPISINTTV